MGNKVFHCECCKDIYLEEIQQRPNMSTPIDRLGYPESCCYCCCPKAVAVFTFVLSLLWTFLEMYLTQRFLTSFLSKEDEMFSVFNTIYFLLCIIFLVGSGILLLGLILKRYELLTVYVWTAFIFYDLYIIINISAIIYKVVIIQTLTKKRAVLKLVVHAAWGFMFIYCLIMVNSYRITLWFKNIGAV